MSEQNKSYSFVYDKENSILNIETKINIDGIAFVNKKRMSFDEVLAIVNFVKDMKC